MDQNYRLGGPEIVGLCIVGATLGAVLCGATLSASTMLMVIGALAGAWILPALFIAPWSRPSRQRAHRLLNEIV